MTEYWLFAFIQSENGKMQTRKTPNTGTFHALKFRGLDYKIFRIQNVNCVLYVHLSHQKHLQSYEK